MATNLVVRNVDEDVALALKQLAAAYGRSAEAEHREILKMALQMGMMNSNYHYVLTTLVCNMD